MTDARRPTLTMSVLRLSFCTFCDYELFKLNSELCINHTSLIEGKLSVCLICMNYRIFLIIIIISLGQILLSYIANTSRTHARTRANTPLPTHTPQSPYRYSMDLCQPTVTAHSAGDNSWRWPLK